jgi:hypothetical protein
VRSHLTVAQQANLVRGAVPSARNRLTRGWLISTVKLQPTELSCIYTVEVRYKPGAPPTVTVLDPELELHPGDSRLPHVYASGELCLNLPDEWAPGMSIGQTILPWASEWLLHYEIWLASGKWTGGGMHPPKGP